MNYIELLGYFSALFIGVVVGIFGGGGSILAVPVFVYLFHLNPILATSYSLFVVGFSAAVGTLINIKKKLINYKTAFIFSLPALFSVFLVRLYFISVIPEVIFDTGSIFITKKMALMLLFSVVILLSSVSMFKKNEPVIAQKLKADGRREWELHREVYRPWGKYDSIDHGDRYQVKRITVNPGAKLSVQMHNYRAEHWVVVSGTAKVTNGEKTFLLSENESTYIPVGVVHALENPGKVVLELIEVQSGSYLGEDDIVRFEDMYNRK